MKPCKLVPTKSKIGYVNVYIRGTGKGAAPKLAHRLSWEEAFGPIPKGMCVCHKCDVRNCVEPTHLFLGTHMDNTQDMIRKGRMRNASGEDNGQSKLNWKKVREIRERFFGGSGEYGECTKLAKEFAISNSVITDIIHNVLWRE